MLDEVVCRERQVYAREMQFSAKTGRYVLWKAIMVALGGDKVALRWMCAVKGRYGAEKSDNCHRRDMCLP